MYKYQRLLQNTLQRLKRPGEAKIIAILGARQVGKTTLLEHFAAQWTGKVLKFTGDKLEDALLWRGRFSDIKNSIELSLKMTMESLGQDCLIIFDEIQKIPEAFDNIKVLHDTYKSKFKIAISGSSSLRLLSKTTESLGGRVELVTMFPLSFAEILNNNSGQLWLDKSKAKFSFIKDAVLKNSDIGRDGERYLEKALVAGLFPEAYLLNDIEEVKLLYQNYHQTYIEKDIRDLKEVGNVLDFDMVWKLAHNTNGQLLSYSNIAKETGLSFNTVKKYISVLSASFNIMLIQPFTRNIKSRLIKSPKIFSEDLGYFNHCLGIFDKNVLTASGIIGRSFESAMVMEFYKQERSMLMRGDPYFFRTSGGAEVDLLVEAGQDLYAYEFKFADKVTHSDFAGLQSLSKTAGRRICAGFVVSRQPHAEKISENLFAVPWWYFCC